MSDEHCTSCRRVTATHAAGCSLLACPHRRPQVWGEPEGLGGFTGSLAEDRIVHRRNERERAVEINLDDL